MKRCIPVLFVTLVLTFAFAVPAFADHSPSFYIEWEPTGGYENANVGGTPHSGYVEGTQKCAVCHATHRAPLAGTGWLDAADRIAIGGDPAQTADGNVEYPTYAGGDNRATRLTYLVPDDTNTQMLLLSSVAGSCDYCHISTAIGGEQLYAGNTKYHVEGDATEGGSDWESGFAHNNACTACHAVHSAFNPGSSFAGEGNKVFQGPIGNKVLKAYAKNMSTTWQMAVVTAGADVTDTELENAGLIPAITVRDSAPNATVSPKNIPLFPSKANALAGTNVRNGTDAAEAQVTAHCTFCHENYGWASEDVINPQNVDITPADVVAQRALADEAKVIGKGLFQGPWVYKSPADGIVRGSRDSASATTFLPGFDGQVPIKNHPMKKADLAFSAAGGNFAGRVAWRSSNTCRDCHDAGLVAGTGVIIQSFPHFTPGYFKFLTAADHQAAGMQNIDPTLASTWTVPTGNAAALAAIQAVLDDPDVIEAAQCTADGACLKCHINSTASAGIGITY